jgi:hypothetical protein
MALKQTNSEPAGNDKKTALHKQRKVSLFFHRAYYSREFGIDYGRRYHEDPLYRLEQEQKCSRALHGRFGEYGMGDPDPKISSFSIGVQPLDFLNAALGGKMCHSASESVWTPEKPLSHIETMEDLKKTPDIDWKNNPLYLDIWRQADIIGKIYPSLPVSSVQGVGKNADGCGFTMHTPCTTAFRLLGDRIFEIMMLEEELADGVFDYLERQYENLWYEIVKHLGWDAEEKARIHLGDCAATMLSPALYEKYCVPRYLKLMRRYKRCAVHSCGPSTHLLKLFTEIPGIERIDLGAKTELQGVRELFPGVLILAYYSAPEMLGVRPAEIEKKIWTMAETLEDNFIINGSSFDPETPIENIMAYLNTARAINEQRGLL